MKRKEVKIGTVLKAWTSLWGEYLIRAVEVTDDRPARVYGVIVKVLKPPYGKRANTPMLGRKLDVGVTCVRLPTPVELVGSQ